MSPVRTRFAAATALALVAGLGVVGSSGTASAADLDETCSGMSAPANTDLANQAPTPANDSARVIAGTMIDINVLANDTDPDADRLYVTGTSTPARGETCVNGRGVITFYAEGSRRSYRTSFTYGVTDGDRYRTATVTVDVLGTRPVQARLTQRLTYKKGTKKAKRPARITFTNPNNHQVMLLGGNAKKDTPAVERTIRRNGSIVVKTKAKRFSYIAVLLTSQEDFAFLNIGLVNTRNGNQRSLYVGEEFRTLDQAARSTGGAPTTAELWAAVRR